MPATERRQYHPGEENVPLSVAVHEAIEAHEHAKEGSAELFDHVSPDVLDRLFQDTESVGVIVQFELDDVYVSIWSDGAIDIRVTDDLEGQLRGT